MKEKECEHFTNSIIYLIEQTHTYCKTKTTQFFNEVGEGLTADQFAILDTISYKPGLSQQDLAKLILKDRSYTSRLINILEEMELIERRMETKEKRLIKALYVKPKGEELLSNYHPKIDKVFLNIFENISAEEFKAMRNGLEKMKNCMSKCTVMPL